MSLPAAGCAFIGYRTRTNNCKKRPITRAEGGQVERWLGGYLIRKTELALEKMVKNYNADNEQC